MATRVGIVGSRRRNTEADKARLWTFLDRYHYLDKDTVEFVSGGCPQGGDRFAEEIAKHHGIKITVFEPDWARYKRGAGLIRNQDIAEGCDLLVALVADDRTGGAEHTIGLVEGLGKPVHILGRSKT